MACSCKLSPVIRQFITIIICNLMTLSFGLAFGWGTINLLELQSNTSSFSFTPLTTEQTALVISILNIGALVGNFTIATVIKLVGAKHTTHFLGVPLILSSLLIIWAQNVYYLYASRLLVGFVMGGVSISISTLITEISFDNVRGNLFALYEPFSSVGIIISFFLGKYLSCLDQAKVQIIVPLISIVLLIFVPESPEYLSKKNNKTKATKSYKYYKGIATQPERATFLAHNPNDGAEKGYPQQYTNRNVSVLKHFQSRHAKKAFLIVFTSFLMSSLCGIMAIISYVTDLFSKTGSIFTEKNSSILISFIMLFTSFTFLCAVERVNRKTLQISSSILTAICYFSFSVYCYLWLKQPGYDWIPTVCLAGLIYFSCMGLIPIPYVIWIEIFPKEIREICLAITLSFAFILSFVTGLIFPFFLAAVGLPAFMAILGAMCLLNALFGQLVLPETRGKSQEEIKILLTK